MKVSEETDVEHCGNADDNRHESVERQFDQGVDHGVIRDGKGWHFTEIGPAYHGREGRGDHQRGKRRRNPFYFLRGYTRCIKLSIHENFKRIT